MAAEILGERTSQEYFGARSVELLIEEEDKRATQLAKRIVLSSDIVNLSALTEVSDWTELMSRGTVSAMSGMSKMLGKEVKITCFDLRPFSLVYACDLISGPETTMVGVYLSIRQEAKGNILMLYPPRVAFGLIDMLMGNEPDTTQEIGEIEASTLSEIGNIVGSHFLSSIADDTGVRLLPTPPQVKADVVGAIIEVALEDVLGMQYGERMFAIQTVFDSEDKRVERSIDDAAKCELPACC